MQPFRVTYKIIIMKNVRNIIGSQFEMTYHKEGNDI